MGFEDRLVKETRELATKLNKLNVFMANESFYALNRVTKDLLYEQNILMTKYIQVLGKRLEIHGIELEQGTL